MTATERMEAYLAGFEPMQRGKVRKALDRQMRLNGKAMFRFQVAEELAAKPYLVRDDAKGRLWTSDCTFLMIQDLTVTAVDYTMHLRNAA